MTITYEYEGALYVNLTNKCNCNCEFCLRHGRKEGSIYTEDSLWLEREPTRQEALDSFLSRDVCAYREIVFCGYGEPTYRIEDILWLVDRLKERFGDDVSVISHDNYYKRHDELPYEERCRLNYDHPDAFDTDLMVEQVQALRRGETIACPVYDFTVHNRSEDTLLIAPTSVIILEGILIFADSKLRDLMDVKIFVDTDADVRILRRVVRDVKKRGRTLESVVQQYLTTVKPMHEQFVEPSKRCADIIVPEGGKNLVALDMIIQRVEHHIRGQQEP